MNHQTLNGKHDVKMMPKRIGKFDTARAFTIGTRPWNYKAYLTDEPTHGQRGMEQRFGLRSCHGYSFRSNHTLCAWHCFAFAPSTRSNLKEGMLPWWRAQQPTFGGVQIKRRYRAHCWQHEISFAFVDKRPSMEMTRRIHPRHNLKPRKPKKTHTQRQKSSRGLTNQKSPPPPPTHTHTHTHTHNERNPTAGRQTKKPIRD